LFKNRSKNEPEKRKRKKKKFPLEMSNDYERQFQNTELKTGMSKVIYIEHTKNKNKQMAPKNVSARQYSKHLSAIPKIDEEEKKQQIIYYSPRPNNIASNI
jgi:hypothetical protein